MDHLRRNIAFWLVTVFWTTSGYAYARPTAESSVTLVPDFALLDHEGQFHQLTKYRHEKAVVLISQANGCASNLEQLTKYHLMKSNFSTDDVVFLMINATGTDSIDAIRAEVEAFDMGFPVLVDDSQLVAADLGLSRAGEIAIIEPQTRRMLFRGPPDIVPRMFALDTFAPEVGRSHIAETLDAMIAGDESRINETLIVEAEGCELRYPTLLSDSRQVPNYESDIAPIIEKNCAVCHREKGIAPFAMDSYKMVRGWSTMMRETLLTKRMPPMQVDPNIRHFDNARYLEKVDLQKLVRWIDSGSPRSNNGEDPLEQLDWPEDDWQLGTPDLVIETPMTKIPATGVLDYVNADLDLALRRDVWVKAIQFLPGNREILHHLVAQVVPPDYNRARDGFSTGSAYFLEGYAPGKEDATTFPPGTGVFIPAGNRINLSIHYTPTGKEQIDITRIGLYFYDSPPQRVLLTKAVRHPFGEIIIPAGKREHRMYHSHQFDEEVTVFALRPHMHTRGKYMQFKAVYPDRTTEPLLSVPSYNFNWQPTYRLSQPITLPAGTRVVVTGAFDNSESQIGNTDPTVTVLGGLQTWDEMFIGYITYAYSAKAVQPGSLAAKSKKVP